MGSSAGTRVCRLIGRPPYHERKVLRIGCDLAKARLLGAGPQRYRVDANCYPRQQGERRIERVLAIALDPAAP